MVLQKIKNIMNPENITELVLNYGKARIYGKNLELREPRYNDAKLLRIMSDTSFSVRLTDTPIKKGISEYDLNSKFGCIKVKIYCPHCVQ